MPESLDLHVGPLTWKDNFGTAYILGQPRGLEPSGGSMWTYEDRSGWSQMAGVGLPAYVSGDTAVYNTPLARSHTAAAVHIMPPNHWSMIDHTHMNVHAGISEGKIRTCIGHLFGGINRGEAPSVLGYILEPLLPLSDLWQFQCVRDADLTPSIVW